MELPKKDALKNSLPKNLKSGSKVQVSAVKEGDKEFIIVEKFPLVEE